MGESSTNLSYLLYSAFAVNMCYGAEKAMLLGEGIIFLISLGGRAQRKHMLKLALDATRNVGEGVGHMGDVCNMTCTGGD
ncbi:unnamed protein product [Dovyalis caffra]|uniref:Uncharacterized protein n=1 Tax=Dovyalis caffra TaxID=77055 RepID=A0AAV1RJ54_9ROSI|nr:unnamed protein product [Dovyalis caffra]